MSISLSGSLVITGSIVASGGITGSFSGSATTSSYALTASSVNPLTQSLSVSGSITATGILTAQTLVVQTITSSIVYSSGSNIFGNQLTNVQQMTGSLRVTGSGNHYIQGGNVGIGTTTPTTTLTVRPINGSTNAFSILDPVGTAQRIAQISFGNATNDGEITLDSNGTNNVRISSNRLSYFNGGNVGIGTNTPSYLLTVSNTSFGGGANGLITLIGGAESSIMLMTTSYGADTNKLILDNATGAMQFRVNSAERMRITSAGYTKASNNGTYYNSTSNQHEFNQSLGGNVTLIVNNTASTGAANGSGILCFTPSADTSEYFLAGSSGGTIKVYIYTNGNIVNTNNSYGPISDIKLKENIVDATPKLDDLMKVRIVNYNLKSDLGYDSSKQIGVIAQELEQVFAGLVDEHIDRDGEGNDLGTTTKSVKMSVFVPMLIKAIQEQQAIITSLQEQINELKNK